LRARPIAAIAATVGGVALLLTFKTPSQANRVDAGGTTSTTGPDQGAPPTTGSPTGSPSSDPSPTTAPGPQGTVPTSAPSTTTAGGGAKVTLTGPLVQTQFGDVQVAAIVNNGKLVDVKALTLPNDRRRSAQISQEAGPLLHDEALQAQSANIDLLSGATYTSAAYAQSLQGALDQIHKNG